MMTFGRAVTFYRHLLVTSVINFHRSSVHQSMSSLNAMHPIVCPAVRTSRAKIVFQADNACDLAMLHRQEDAPQLSAPALDTRASVQTERDVRASLAEEKAARRESEIKCCPVCGDSLVLPGPLRSKSAIAAAEVTVVLLK